MEFIIGADRDPTLTQIPLFASSNSWRQFKGLSSATIPIATVAHVTAGRNSLR
jgi:hypothetical protein